MNFGPPPEKPAENVGPLPPVPRLSWREAFGLAPGSNFFWDTCGFLFWWSTTTRLGQKVGVIYLGKCPVFLLALLQLPLLTDQG